MTTRPCDFYGGSAKSVLNKPLMELYCTTNTSWPASTMTTVLLDNVVINEISGASLDPSTGKVTLPAGVYDFDGQIPFRSAAVDGQYVAVGAFIIDDAGNQIGIGTRTSARNDRNANVAPIATRITLAATTSVRLALLTGGNEGNAESGLTGADIQKYGTLRIVKVDSNVETPVISDPSMVLARPLFHAQDQKATGTDGGSSVTNALNDRDLNTVLTNEIIGASLSSNEITLPAGTYFVDARCAGYQVNGHRALICETDDTILLTGGTYRTMSTDTLQQMATVSGRITLSATTTIKLAHRTNRPQATNGLGLSNNNIDVEVYADIRIWQLDSLVRQPVLVNDKLYPLPGNVIVTGNMHGLEYDYNTVDSITVQAGICMDSLNETVLTLQNPQLVDLTNPAINPEGILPSTLYHIFLTDDNQLVKLDTDVNGVNLPVGDKRRWLGMFTTRDTSDIRSFRTSGDELEWSSGIIIATTVANTVTVLGISSFIEISRIINFEVSCTTTENGAVYFYTTDISGTSNGSTKVRGNSLQASHGMFATFSNRTGKFAYFIGQAGRSILLSRIRMKR